MHTCDILLLAGHVSQALYAELPVTFVYVLGGSDRQVAPPAAG